MRLSYRGLPYDYEPPAIDVAETQLQGRYRGQAINFSYPRHVSVPQPALDLQYRGIPYHTTTAGVIEARLASPSSAKPSLTKAPELLPIRMHKQSIIREAAAVHKSNIQQLLRHRLEVAQARGDQQLVSQLKREMHQFT